MFGDIGHGLVMFLAGLYLVLKEGYFTKRLKSYEEVSFLFHPVSHLWLFLNCKFLLLGSVANDNLKDFGKSSTNMSQHFSVDILDDVPRSVHNHDEWNVRRVRWIPL